MKNIVYTLIASGLLVGCKVGQNYQRPEQNLPESFLDSQQQNQQVNALGKVTWQQFFKNSELIGLIELALEQNTDLLLSVKNMQQSELLFKQSKLALLPQVGLDITGARTESSKNSAVGLSGENRLNNDFTASLDLSWELDIWGKIRREKEAKLAMYLQSQQVKKAVENRLIAQVATTYINLLMLDEQLKIAEKSIELRYNTYDLTQKMFQVGNANILGVEQSKAQWIESKEVLTQIQTEIALQQSALNLLLNQYPQEIKRTTTLKDLDLTSDLSHGVPADFVSQRPDIQIAEFNLRAANAKVGAAQGQMYPNLTISASGGLNAIQGSDWFNTPGSLFGMVAGGIIQPIFNQKKLRTAYQVAKVERDKAAIEFKAAVIASFTDVHNTLVKIDKVKQQGELMGTRVEILSTSLNNTKFMFEMDKATYLELINAQGLSLAADLSFAELKRDYLINLVELYRVLAGQ
ncbi:efflux transporter outer membrane subunit [Myroides sp. LJL119]